MRKSTREAINILKAIAADQDVEVDKGGLVQAAKVGMAVADKIAGAAKKPSKDKAESCPGEDPDAEDVEKALKAAAIVGIAKQQRFHEYSAGVAQEQPALGTNRLRGDYEPPVVPTRRVDQPFGQPSIAAPAMLKSCEQCGSVHKSVAECPRCARIAQLGGEALPLHFRGR